MLMNMKKSMRPVMARWTRLPIQMYRPRLTGSDSQPPVTGALLALSYSDLSSTYGIPFHSEAAHEEHGEEHEGEHDGEHAEEDEGEEHHDEHEGAHHDEHGDERIFSKTDSEVIALSGSFKTSLPFLNAIDFTVKNTDYELTEQHAEGEDGEEVTEGHDHEEGPTVFSNEATKYRLRLDSERW